MVRRCENTMVGSFCALIYFIPISNGLSEWSFGIAFIAFNIKRYFLFDFELKCNSWGTPKSLWKKIKLFLEMFKPKSSYLSWPIGIYLLVAFASIFVSHYPLDSLKGFVFKLLQGTYLYFMFIECMNTKKRLRVFLFILFVSVAIITANGIVQYIFGEGFIFHHTMSGPQLISTFKHGNDYGSYLIVMVMIFFGMWLSSFFSQEIVNQTITQERSLNVFRTLPVRLIIFLIALSSFLNLGLTLSRGAWLGFLIAMVFLGVVNRKTVMIIIPICVIFYAVFYPLMKDYRKVSFFSDNIKSLEKTYQSEDIQRENLTKDWANGENLSEDSWKEKDALSNFSLAEKRNTLFSEFSGMGRKGFWQEAIAIIKDYPILGTGLNTYSKVAPKYKVNWGGYAHNCYLQMAAELGLVGLSVFIWIMFTLFRRSIKSMQFVQDPILLSILAGALSGLFGFLVHSGVDTALYSGKLFNLMWVIMGLIVTIQVLETEKNF